ncbi:MAG: arsenic resistance protein [Candidatus Methanofastidiosa archaeon]|jgi:ACR3 family arsenite efflux pump ArsB|nr:arsenic resistance protein [Candidatus Methanofastidiosa archaeon]
MSGVLEFIQKKFLILLPAVILIGIIFGYFYDLTFLKLLTLPLTFLMIFPPLLSIDTRKIISRDDFFLQIVAIFINFIIIPFTFYNIGTMFFSDNIALMGFLLIGLIPTTGMTLSWTALSNGDINSSVKIIIINLLLSALLTPLYVKLFMGKVLNISLEGIFYPIFLIVILSLSCGYLSQRILIRKFGIIKFEEQLKPKAPIFSIFGVLGIVFVIMSSDSHYILTYPLEVLYSTIPAILFYLFGYPVVTALGLTLFDEKKAVSLLYGTVMRNFPLVISISFIIFQGTTHLISIALSIVYMLQIESSGFYVRYAPIIFKDNFIIRIEEIFPKKNVIQYKKLSRHIQSLQK